MATEPAPPGPQNAPKAQRVYRAACPNCGAPVAFASAASASAVCSFCRSTLVREGDALRRIGLSAELFDDYSPLQLGAAGRYQGLPFSLVGRLQYRYAEGSWNEWHALFETQADGTARSGWLSEDNGAYVLSFDLPPLADAPPAAQLRAGERRTVGGQAWNVASVVEAKLAAAEGELLHPPALDQAFVVADLRNAAGEVATLDYSRPDQVGWSIGRSVALAALSMTGLREAPEKTLASGALACPSCGAALAPSLASTRSLTCRQCQAVVDISQGLGGDLAFYAQNNSGVGGLEPQIPLGSVGRLTLGAEGPLDWQVVGYQERCDLPRPGGDEEQTFWREYLLYHRTAGFAFLVDSEDGWSSVRPLTGAPAARGDGATWSGLFFRQTAAYNAKVTWIQGEFYWRVQRDERAAVTDYDGPRGAKLSREQTANEVTWSLGKALPVELVADAFRIPASARAALRRDAQPLSGLVGLGSFGGGDPVRGIGQVLLILLLILVVVWLLSRCDGDDCRQQLQLFGENSNEYQQCRASRSSGGFHGGGGSFGGFSSGGGGHK